MSATLIRYANYGSRCSGFAVAGSWLKTLVLATDDDYATLTALDAARSPHCYATDEAGQFWIGAKLARGYGIARAPGNG